MIQIINKRNENGYLDFDWNPPRRSDDLAKRLHAHYPLVESTEERMMAAASAANYRQPGAQVPQRSPTSSLSRNLGSGVHQNLVNMSYQSEDMGGPAMADRNQSKPLAKPAGGSSKGKRTRRKFSPEEKKRVAKNRGMAVILLFVQIIFSTKVENSSVSSSNNQHSSTTDSYVNSPDSPFTSSASANVSSTGAWASNYNAPPGGFNPPTSYDQGVNLRRAATDPVVGYQVGFRHPTSVPSQMNTQNFNMTSESSYGFMPATDASSAFPAANMNQWPGFDDTGMAAQNSYEHQYTENSVQDSHQGVPGYGNAGNFQPYAAVGATIQPQSGQHRPSLADRYYGPDLYPDTEEPSTIRGGIKVEPIEEKGVSIEELKDMVHKIYAMHVQNKKKKEQKAGGIKTWLRGLLSISH
ncbi:hypothetical protein G7Y89_g8650 [Cudoniella acicularis]|uniref:Uncharacterized protein n=1 Tax=Cudoniella acicularis TaxID=354080 RepID=A0A8H4RJW0_9HELO|nr:hypothetical protein G7Y89_g8650 [Cudoniella acicularis]